MLAESIASAARQAAGLGETGHRPWVLPEQPWLQGQTWDRLLFAHWPVPPEQVEPHLPAGLDLDVRDGSGWVGVTPFRVSALRVRGAVPLPVVSAFLEVNVRTYVTRRGRPGIWFFSLDASSRLAVAGARLIYRLPYHLARIRLDRRGDLHECSCVREGGGRPYVLEAAYRAAGDRFSAEPGSLEHFLVERYRLYAVGRDGRLAAADIHHPPWSLRTAEARIDLNTMAPNGIRLAGEPLLHVAERQDAVIWPLGRT